MSDAPLHDPSALAQYGHIEVVSRLVVEGYMMGQHKSPFKGSSVEFVEHRQYYPGDEIRHIDWRAYGKTGKYYIKEFEEETNLRAYLLLDSSGSMAYGDSTLSKFEYARLLAASLAYLLHSQRDAVGLISFDTKERLRVEPSTNPKVFRQMMQALAETKPGQETSLGTFFEKVIPTLKRRSLVIILSDFFDDPQKLEKAVQLLKRNRHDVILFQVLAPEEEEFPYSKPTQFRSLERDAHRLLVDPNRLRSIYLKQFHQFQEDLSHIAGSSGFDLTNMKTTTPFDKALGAYLDWRTRRSQGIAGGR
ncbi:MAG: DUF58 domain-containing protein [Planctomycetaceae bacterium]|nr:DUF58 domain-containing protein [Planctomycetaceae bacterium]